MAKKMLIDATHAEETRVVVVDGNKVEEFDFESENKRQLAGNIYLAKVTRVEPSLQAAFVDYGGNRHGFLAFSEIHPDYYQIPVADRKALMEEEQAYAEAQQREEEEDKPKRSRSRSRTRTSTRSESTRSDDATTSIEVSGMETIDLDDEETSDTEGLSPMETVAATPVEEPAGEQDQPEEMHGDDADDEGQQASDRDESIEAVADDDTEEDFRPVRKPRPRRYKIQEVIKVRQILLVQVVKEERGNKGAALTTYLSLAGRYCVLMPNTARGGGISRKITNAADRSKLKEIAQTIEVPKGAGLIVRTAGAKRTKTEIKRDYEYLQRLWEQIRELTLKSIAPAKIYEEGDLIKRSIRDLYNRDIDEVFVEGERGYRIAKDFMKMIMPSHAKNVKHYGESMPLFARYQVESYLSSMFNPTVQLKSGGYIVIGVTEALVAIDVNSGRATKEGSIEETAFKTNLEAAEEVARQLRLRDLAGLIVIDFIDMDERKNNLAVEKKIKDKLKTDRARIQVGRISGFGLMEMSRQRLRPGMIEATTAPCPACHGTGLIRSDDNLALSILREIEEEGVRNRSREVLAKCPVGIANYLMNMKREHIAQIEIRYGMAVRIEGDAHLVSPDFSLEKFKTATRTVPEPSAYVVSVDTSLMDQVDEDQVDEDEDEDEADVEEVQQDVSEMPEQPREPQPEASEDDGKPKKRRRRRRRSRGKSSNGSETGDQSSDDDDSTDTSPAEGIDAVTEVPAAAAAMAQTPAEVRSEATEIPAEADAEAEAPAPKPKRTRTRAKKPAVDAPAETAEDAAPEPVKPKRTRSRSRKKVEEVTEAPADPVDDPIVTEAEATPAPVDAAIQAETLPEPEAVQEPETLAGEPPVETVEEEAVQVADDAADQEPQTVPVADAPETPVDADAPAEAEAEPETADDTARELEPADGQSDSMEESKPKKRGWWSIGR